MAADLKTQVQAASACVFRKGEVLLVQRGQALGKGLWALPGGKVEAGESAEAAALRELLEEAAITAEVQAYLGVFHVQNYAISCFAVTWISGEPKAGGDAADARFFALEDVSGLALAPQIDEAIAKARALLKI